VKYIWGIRKPEIGLSVKEGRPFRAACRDKYTEEPILANEDLDKKGICLESCGGIGLIGMGICESFEWNTQKPMCGGLSSTSS
jgi:hypothetical protein